MFKPTFDAIENLLPYAVLALVLAMLFWSVFRHRRRLRYLREAPLPRGIFSKLRARRPDIDPAQFPRIERALRDFFEAYLRGGRKPVSMPSQAADELWHEFILHTRHYQQFCAKAFGCFLHHSPATVLSKRYDRNVGLRRVWWYCCKREGIDPRKATHLPLLFALDTQLALADGFHYAVDCRGLRKRTDDTAGGGCGTQCATDMSDSSFDGTTDGFGDSGSDASGSDGGGDSGGCGGGCGGD